MGIVRTCAGIALVSVFAAAAAVAGFVWWFVSGSPEFPPPEKLAEREQIDAALATVPDMPGAALVSEQWDGERWKPMGVVAYRLYEVDARLDDIVAFYAEALPAAGWTRCRASSVEGYRPSEGWCGFRVRLDLSTVSDEGSTVRYVLRGEMNRDRSPCSTPSGIRGAVCPQRGDES